MVELLSPVGDFDCLKAAVQNGANAVYFGGQLFNARYSAKNFDKDGIRDAVNYAKSRNVKINFTLNILLKNNEFDDAVDIVKYIYELGVDAVIVDDLGFAKYIIDNFPGMEVHGSTQMTIHNLDGAIALKNLGYSRVVLARESTLSDIDYIAVMQTLILKLLFMVLFVFHTLVNVYFLVLLVVDLVIVVDVLNLVVCITICLRPLIMFLIKILEKDF